jgi:hypothetical protein
MLFVDEQLNNIYGLYEPSSASTAAVIRQPML